MKAVLIFICMLALVWPAESAAPKAKRRYVLYATLLEPTPVRLETGAEWMMDKGDSFPVLMFKEMQTKVVLQLAGTSFRVDAKQVRIVEEAQVTPAMLASYRRNVQVYLEGSTRRWKEQASGGLGASAER